MIDPYQLMQYVIRPAVKPIDGDNLCSANLLLGTAAAETGLQAIRQYGGGPALGLWQMEPATEESLWRHHLYYRPQRRRVIWDVAQIYRTVEEDGTMWPELGDELIWNLRYGVIMARIKYLTDPEPLPAKDDWQGMAETWKRIYNSSLGAGTPEKFIKALEQVEEALL